MEEEKREAMAQQKREIAEMERRAAVREEENKMAREEKERRVAEERRKALEEVARRDKLSGGVSVLEQGATALDIEELEEPEVITVIVTITLAITLTLTLDTCIKDGREPYHSKAKSPRSQFNSGIQEMDTDAAPEDPITTKSIRP